MIAKGRLKKVENSTLGPEHHSPLKIPKNKQILPPQMPDFAAPRAITATTCKILSTISAILALTWFLDHLEQKK